ncbi:uncharacterized protein EDB91DRAFT_1288260 [Suillus paluster]|uniref:uncharacterized protein n=1 Tax=Suillus paluster TaxID=48578 RepID=UPI001B87ACEF|nr:uncharacterized protein EDB91DRAFT_1288260 [Suillus paluster]KAG1719588.1 hypothetical protein EDB91DRAFT_1288260 [Suillus paluster]
MLALSLHMPESPMATPDWQLASSAMQAWSSSISLQTQSILSWRACRNRKDDIDTGFVNVDLGKFMVLILKAESDFLQILGSRASGANARECFPASEIPALILAFETPDQDSMRSTLQSCLECLDGHNDRMVGLYREILEIRTRITELLARCPSEVTVGDPGAGNSTVDLQAILDDEPQTVVPDTLDEPNAIMLLSTLPDFSFLLPVL